MLRLAHWAPSYTCMQYMQLYTPQHVRAWCGGVLRSFCGAPDHVAFFSAPLSSSLLNCYFTKAGTWMIMELEHFTAQGLADHIPGTHLLYNSMQSLSWEKMPTAVFLLNHKIMSIRDFQLKEYQINCREYEGQKLIAFTYIHVQY